MRARRAQQHGARGRQGTQNLPRDHPPLTQRRGQLTDQGLGKGGKRQRHMQNPGKQTGGSGAEEDLGLLSLPRVLAYTEVRAMALIRIKAPMGVRSLGPRPRATPHTHGH